MASAIQAGAQRSAWLGTLGVSGPPLEALASYDDRLLGEVDGPWRVPLDDEPFVATWRELLTEAESEGPWAVLSRHLRPLAFPIRAGISETAGYRRVVRRGLPATDEPTAEGLRLRRPDAIELTLHASLAGTLPVITVPDRQDFVQLVQALAKRNEPVDVSPSQGASMVAGLVNWRRFGALRTAWWSQPPEERPTKTWRQEVVRLEQHKELYLDRFMLLSVGPYAAVSGDCLGLDPGFWRSRSWVVRCEHECTHYWTRRVFGTMRNHLLDELLADYNGLTAALGRFRADVFLRCLGFDSDGCYRPGSRLDLYRDDLPRAADPALHRLVTNAAHHVEHFDRRVWPDEDERSVEQRARALHTLAGLRLSELAGPEAVDRLLERWARCTTDERDP